jgi:hypothetical protein
MYVLQDDGKIKGPSGNILDLGKASSDPVSIPGSTVIIPGAVAILGGIAVGANAQALAIPAGTSAATNTTVTIAGTGATLLADSKVNGTLGTVAYTFNDLVRALKVAGVIAQ